VKVLITAILQDADGYDRNVGTQEEIDRNIPKQKVLKLWRRVCREREGFRGSVEHFPRKATDVKRKDQFSRETPPP
jgi:hypothetical protein